MEEKVVRKIVNSCLKEVKVEVPREAIKWESVLQSGGSNGESHKSLFCQPTFLFIPLLRQDFSPFHLKEALHDFSLTYLNSQHPCNLEQLLYNTYELLSLGFTSGK